jgi:hypothetical protein
MHSSREALTTKRSAGLVLALCAICLLSGCGESKKAFNEAYDKAFIEGWRERFVSSCAGGDERKSTVCNCIADKSIASLSADQLKDFAVIKEKILPQCANSN